MNPLAAAPAEVAPRIGPVVVQREVLTARRDGNEQDTPGGRERQQDPEERREPPQPLPEGTAGGHGVFPFSFSPGTSPRHRDRPPGQVPDAAAAPVCPAPAAAARPTGGTARACTPRSSPP